ncbi:cytochrome P450 [Nocardia sp. NPDC002869]|uniref:cytochrome P450 n=1 Tax=Nocardia sp. NPDC002869 TaxID=3161032 RepID=UPI00398CF510
MLVTDSVVPHPEIDTDYDPTRSPHREDPFQYYAWSQVNAPVIWNPAIGAWLLTRYRDIERVVADTETFSNASAVPPLDKLLPPDVLNIIAQAGPPGRHMLQTDPPEHRAMRRIGHAVMDGQRIQRQVPYMRELAASLIDVFVDDGAVELVAGFTLPYVKRVLSRLVGIPESDMDRVETWNDAFLGLMSPLIGHDRKIELAHQYVEYELYLEQLIADRRADPRDDIVSDLVRFYADEQIPDDRALPDMKMFIRGLYAGGIHTTADGIDSAVYLMLTADDGGLWREAAVRPAVIPEIWEETLRLEAPHRGLSRLATRDVEIGGKTIEQGQQVLLLFGAANRDPDVFGEPDRFRRGRENIRRHMAFGQGIHRCLGRILAHHEGIEGLAMLADRLPRAQIAPSYHPSYSPAFYFRGLQQLDLVW